MTTFQRFLLGFGFLFKGVRGTFVIPGLLKWIIFPLAINLSLLLTGFFWGWSNVSAWTASVVEFFLIEDGIWYQIFYYPLIVIFGLVFFVVLGYGVFLISTVVASPFNGILAEKTLKENGQLPATDLDFWGWTKLCFRMLRVSALRAALFGVLGVVLFLCSYIPGVNLVSSFCIFLIIGFDCMDYAMEIKGFSLNERINFFKTHRPEFIGMGSLVGIVSLIPGFIILLLPFLVVGASQVFCLIEQTKKEV